MKGKDLNKILRDHKHFKQLLATPVPEDMFRYPGGEQYLIGHTQKMCMVTWRKKKLTRRLQTLRTVNKSFTGLTTEQVYERLFKHHIGKTFEDYQK